jgi:predicted nucleic acid-binding protein
VARRNRAFFDTNLFVYLFDRDDPSRQQRAAELVAAHEQQDSIVISTQVLQEFFAVVTRKPAVRLSFARARREVERLATLDPVVVDPRLVLAAIDRSEAARLSIWDSLIVEAALRADCAVLYSEDLQHDRTIDNRLRVVNPFAS